MDKIFVGVKNNLVVNTIVIDDTDKDLIEKIKAEFNYDYLAECDDVQVNIGWDFDGVGVVPPKPFNSWVFNQSTRQWEPPVPMPDDKKVYEWDESTISWIEVTNPFNHKE